ncbi:MAG TPA: acetyl-CoA C-acetyltransferase [Gemmatimonadota bacterium]|nr:acetyl-CoA C-acetyltransferase [Gemmatimonadota bacterium]
MNDVSDRTTPVIVSACRTPIGKFLGGLSPKTAPELGAIAIREAISRAGIDPETIDEVIMGQVVQAGSGQAPARQAAHFGGVPDTVPAMTVNKVCGSGLKAVMLAAQSIKAGDQECVVAGGQESMSNAPFLLHGAREGLKFGDQKLVDAMVKDGLWCAFESVHMGKHAELTAEKSEISRQEQDEFALGSHRKAVEAIEEGRFQPEIVPVEIETRMGTTTVDTDECPRAETSLEVLARLKPAFSKEGTVTAGNAPGLNDGASALVVTSVAYAREHGLEPMARIVGYASAGTEPKLLFYAPVFAVRELMKRTGSGLDDYDLIEANEAFAVQALADGKELGWDWERVNVNGGAVALGHPIGASGARVLTTLLYALRDRDERRGMATLCLGGGNAVAMEVERL